METVAGMTPTGRRFAGPAGDLVELDAPSGLKHTAIVFHPEYRQHDALNAGLKPVLSFLEKPLVTGLVGLGARDPREGAFVYPTGTVWSVAEIVRRLADQGRTGGVKAGLELLYLASNTLLEAAETGARQGVYSHGALSPWRILVKADGQVQIIGYGLPMVEILAFQEDESLVPREDSFRYCPPERLDGQPEDASSDIFGLALIGFELMTGRPVYDGLASDIRQQATRAEGSRRLYQMRDQLPETVREVLGRALKFDPDTRFPSANDFVYAVHDLLSSPDADGPALIELMQKVRGAEKRSPVLMGGKTGTLTREQLAALRAELEEPDPKPLPPPVRPRPDNEPAPPPEPETPQRWGRVARQPTRPEPVRAEPTRAEPRTSSDTSRPTHRSADEPRRIRSAEDGPRRIRGADEGPRRIRAEDPRQPERSEPGARPVAAAEALLERLRVSASREMAPARQPDPPRAAEPPPVAEPPPRAPEPPPRAAEPVARAPDPPAPEPVIRAPEPPPRAAEPVARAPEPPPRAQEPPAAPVMRSGDAPRPGREELVYYQVVLDGGPPQRTRLRTSEALAETANRLVQAIAAPPTDLCGNATGWYRLEQDGRRWRGDQTVSVLDADRPVHLVFVPNRVVRAEISVEGVAAPLRFVAPVGTAVPARSIVAHLQRWLALPEGTWALHAAGATLGPMQILEELEPGEGFPLVLRR